MTRIGPYEVEDVLARGGMGVVYRARGPGGDEVAIKHLLAQRSANDRARRRFTTEIEALIKLQHPGVVEILAVGSQEGVPWLAMEYVPGQSLAARLREGALPIEEAIRVVRSLAETLAHVHACGVIHRDLTPGNVLLADDGRVLLTDFGLARDERSERTRVTRKGAFLGTPGFWPPEQAHGDVESMGPRSDVYGLGGVLYACLTTHPPLEVETFGEFLAGGDPDPPQPPREVRPEIPAWLEALCLSCLALDPERRPPSASTVARALSAQSWTVPARRLPSWLVGFAAGALLVGCAVAGFGVFAVRQRGAASAPETALAPRVAEGRALLADNLPDEALSCFEAALAADPQDTLAALGRGDSLCALGRWPEAHDAFRALSEAQPTCVDAWVGRGACLSLLERHAEAIEVFDHALTLDPENPGRLRGMRDMARRMLETQR